MRSLLVGEDAELVGDARGEHLAETGLDEVGGAELLESLGVVSGLESWMTEEEGALEIKTTSATRRRVSERKVAPSRVAANWEGRHVGQLSDSSASG